VVVVQELSLLLLFFLLLLLIGLEVLLSLQVLHESRNPTALCLLIGSLLRLFIFSLLSIVVNQLVDFFLS
jgi:uncharacterized PurR-regulated membrane protein YhhQ (DUF165 family)